MRRILLAISVVLAPALADPLIVRIDTLSSGLKATGEVVLRGARTTPLSISAPAGDSLRVTLDSVSLSDTAIYLDGPVLSFSGNVHLFLKSRNTVRGGSQSSPPLGYSNPRCAVKADVAPGSRLRIDAAPDDPAGSLWITGDGFYAGLCNGGVLSSGEVHATGGTNGPGVRTIRIEGGTLVAQGGTGRAGLEGPDLEIAGGKVLAIGGSFSAGIATSVEAGAGGFFTSFTLRISGGEVDAVAGNVNDAIGRQDSRYPKLDPCGRVEITGGVVRTWADDSGKGETRWICGDSLRIRGGTVLSKLESRWSLLIQGGSLPYVHGGILPPRWNGTDTTRVLRIGGLPRETLVDSLFLSSDPRYGTRDLRTDSGGWLGLVVPRGPLQGFVRVQGTEWTFSTQVGNTDTNVVRLAPRTGIERRTSSSRLAVRAVAGKVVVEGLRAGEAIEVLDPRGRREVARRAEGSRQELSRIPAGVHFLRRGMDVVKFVSGG